MKRNLEQYGNELIIKDKISETILLHFFVKSETIRKQEEKILEKIGKRKTTYRDTIKYLINEKKYLTKVGGKKNNCDYIANLNFYFDYIKEKRGEELPIETKRIIELLFALDNTREIVINIAKEGNRLIDIIQDIINGFLLLPNIRQYLNIKIEKYPEISYTDYPFDENLEKNIYNYIKTGEPIKEKIIELFEEDHNNWLDNQIKKDTGLYFLHSKEGQIPLEEYKRMHKEIEEYLNKYKKEVQEFSKENIIAFHLASYIISASKNLKYYKDLIYQQLYSKKVFSNIFTDEFIDKWNE